MDLNDLQPRAFPLEDLKTGDVLSEGMLLRDYFAAKAMQGFISQQSTTNGHWGVDARSSYEVADALMAEKHRTEGVDLDAASIKASAPAMLEIIRGFLANVMAPNPHPQDMDFVCAAAQSLIERVTGEKFELAPDDKGKAND